MSLNIPPISPSTIRFIEKLQEVSQQSSDAYLRKKVLKTSSSEELVDWGVTKTQGERCSLDAINAAAKEALADLERAVSPSATTVQYWADRSTRLSQLASALKAHELRVEKSVGSHFSFKVYSFFKNILGRAVDIFLKVLGKSPYRTIEELQKLNLQVETRLKEVNQKLKKSQDVSLHSRIPSPLPRQSTVPFPPPPSSSPQTEPMKPPLPGDDSSVLPTGQPENAPPRTPSPVAPTGIEQLPPPPVSPVPQLFVTSPLQPPPSPPPSPPETSPLKPPLPGDASPVLPTAQPELLPSPPASSLSQHLHPELLPPRISSPAAPQGTESLLPAPPSLPKTEPLTPPLPGDTSPVLPTAQPELLPPPPASSLPQHLHPDLLPPRISSPAAPPGTESLLPPPPSSPKTEPMKPPLPASTAPVLPTGQPEKASPRIPSPVAPPGTEQLPPPLPAPQPLRQEPLSPLLASGLPIQQPLPSSPAPRPSSTEPHSAPDALTPSSPPEDQLEQSDAWECVDSGPFPSLLPSRVSEEEIRQITQSLKAFEQVEKQLEFIGCIQEQVLDDPHVADLIRQVTLDPPSKISDRPQTVLEGEVRVAHRQLIDLLLGVNPTICLQPEQIVPMESLVERLMVLYPRCRHKDLLSSIALACRYLSNHYRILHIKDVIPSERERSFYYLHLPDRLSLTPEHQLGDLDRFRGSLRPGNVSWIRVGSSMIRGCKARVSLREDRALNFVFTMPFNARQELERAIQRLKDVPVRGLRIVEKEAVYSSRDGKTRVKVGTEYALQSTDNRIVLRVGNNTAEWNLYEKVSIEVSPEVTSQELYQFLAAIGLASIVLDPRPQDIMQARLAQLAMANSPRLYFHSPEAWAQHALILPEFPERAQRMVTNPDLGEDIDPSAVKIFKNLGGVGFGATVGFGRTLGIFEMIRHFRFYEISSVGEAATTIGHLCRGGFLSSMERFERGIVGSGCCPEQNIQTGSANQVFTRLLTQRQFKEEFRWDEFAIPGSIFVLLKPQAAERLPYAYSTDLAGLRNPAYRGTLLRLPQREMPSRGLSGKDIKMYQKSLEELVVEQERDPVSPTAEVMFEQMLSRNYLAGFLVATPKDKEMLIQNLQGEGIHDLNGEPLDKVIIVSPTFDHNVLQLLGGS